MYAREVEVLWVCSVSVSPWMGLALGYRLLEVEKREENNLIADRVFYSNETCTGNRYSTSSHISVKSSQVCLRVEWTINSLFILRVFEQNLHSPHHQSPGQAMTWAIIAQSELLRQSRVCEWDTRGTFNPAQSPVSSLEGPSSSATTSISGQHVRSYIV